MTDRDEFLHNEHTPEWWDGWFHGMYLFSQFIDEIMPFYDGLDENTDFAKGIDHTLDDATGIYNQYMMWSFRKRPEMPGWFKT